MDIESLLKLAKKHKLKRLEVDGISFEFKDPTPRKRNVSRETLTTSQGEIQVNGGMPPDDVMLFYSSEPQLEEKTKPN